MAETMFHVRQDGIQFYLNTESSSPNTGHRNRYRLFKTENFGRDKAGWVQIGSQAGHQLIAIENDTNRFEACVKAFSQATPSVPGARADPRETRQVGGRRFPGPSRSRA